MLTMVLAGHVFFVFFIIVIEVLRSKAATKLDRVDCFPERKEPAQQICEDRGCIWDDDTTENKGFPRCYFGSGHGYNAFGEIMGTKLGYSLLLKKIGLKTLFGGDLQEIDFNVEFQTKTRVHFTFSDVKKQRYRVPFELPKIPREANGLHYMVNITMTPFSVKITRKDTDMVLWDSSLGPIIFSDQFLQISTWLPSKYVYGFGEQEHDAFLHDLQWQRLGMFARGRHPFRKGNSYGVHPFYMCLEEDGKAHGVFLLNSNAMDVQLQPSPGLTFRTTGGVLDFFLFTGPTPEDVIKQYAELIGRTIMPPYWALGFQLCRYGYKNLQDVQAVVNGMAENDLPLDVQYGDIDYMERQLDFTYDKKNFAGLPEYVKSLKERGVRFIIILDPGISANETDYDAYEKGTQADVWIKNKDNEPLFAKYWPQYPSVVVNKSLARAKQIELYHAFIVFPDFFSAEAGQWWIEQITKFHKLLEFDGLWIHTQQEMSGQRHAMIFAKKPAKMSSPKHVQSHPFTCRKIMLVLLKPRTGFLKKRFAYSGTKLWADMPENDVNEPKQFFNGSVTGCEDSTYNIPPYLPWLVPGEDSLTTRTICMDSVQALNGGTLHYNVHSLYGWSQSKPTARAAQEATGKRSIVISRSTFAGSGKYVGHWLGDNKSAWRQMHKSVIGMLEFNLFGIPYPWLARIGRLRPQRALLHGGMDLSPPRSVGADICGFMGNTTFDLCVRWMQLGAFYPFSRNHNSEKSAAQDPGSFGKEFADLVRPAMIIRYTLLPYLYTLFYHSRTTGATVVRPLMHEFTHDKETWGIDKQFLWGPALLITPVLEKEKTSVRGYISQGRWFYFKTGIEHEMAQGWNDFEAPLNTITLHVRGGYVLPLQGVANNTVYSRQKPLELICALDDEETANGQLFWDDGVSIDTIGNGNYDLIEFLVHKGKLEVKPVQITDVLPPPPPLNVVTVFGLKMANVTSVTVNGKDWNWFIYDSRKKVLQVLKTNLVVTKRNDIEWKNDEQSSSRFSILHLPEIILLTAIAFLLYLFRFR